MADDCSLRGCFWNSFCVFVSPASFPVLLRCSFAFHCSERRRALRRRISWTRSRDWRWILVVQVLEALEPCVVYSEATTKQYMRTVRFYTEVLAVIMHPNGPAAIFRTKALEDRSSPASMILEPFHVYDHLLVQSQSFLAHSLSNERLVLVRIGRPRRIAA